MSQSSFPARVTHSPWMKKLPMFALLFLVSAIAVGCAPKGIYPGLETLFPPQRAEMDASINAIAGQWPRTRWWEDYRDPQLNRLVERALAGSPTMEIASKRVEQARTQVDLANSSTRLQLTALGAINRQRVSRNGFLGPFATDEPAMGMTGPWYTQGIAGAVSTLNLDIWGTQRSVVDAAIGLENARIAERAAVELKVAGNVTRLYFHMQALLKKVDLLTQTRASAAQGQALHQARAERGLESYTPNAHARMASLQVDQRMSLAQSEYAQLREALRALMGAGPHDELSIASVGLPDADFGVPDSLSYELLARRPDLQVSRWYVQSSFNQIDAARAAYYPSFDIKAFIGVDALHLDDLLTHSSRQFNLLPGFTLPIFDGGRLDANLANAETASQIFIQQYNQAVLNAVRDVAVMATRVQTNEGEQALQIERVEQATFIWKSVTAHLDQGLIAAASADEARIPLLAQQMEHLDIRERLLVDQISLVEALGGGYRAKCPVRQSRIVCGR